MAAKHPDQWEILKGKVLNQHLTDCLDDVSWKWSKNGKFTVKSIYEHLARTDAGDPHTRIWKAKIPYKIKIFLWLLEKGATLTKENMVKGNWAGDPSCRFCEELETSDHLFIQCHVAKVVWGTIALCLNTDTIPCNTRQFWACIATHLPRGDNAYVCGLATIGLAIWKARNKKIKHPAEIVCHACSLMLYWRGLHKQDSQKE